MSDEKVEEVSLIQEALNQQGIKEELKSNNSMDDLAKQYGWKPDGERSAEEFIKYAMDLERSYRGKELKGLRKTVDQLKDHMKKQEEQAYAKALSDIKAQQNQAVQNGDLQRVEQLKQQEQAMQPLPEAVSEFAEKYSDLLADNSYDGLEIRKWLVSTDQQLGAQGLNPDKHMKILEQHLQQHLKKNYPTYGSQDEEEEMPKRAAVESDLRSNVANKSSSDKKKSYTYKDLNEEQKLIAKNFADMGIMTVEKYIEDLVKHGEVS